MSLKIVSIALSLLIVCPNLTYGRQAPKAEAKTEEAATAGKVEIPKDGEVCFSPDEPCDQKLIAFIGTAQKSIDVAIYDITLDELAHKLLVLSKTIPVRIVVDSRQAKGKHSLVSMLVKAGANIRYGHQRGIMHNKFTVVDGKMVETGSFNYTNHASRANNENQIYLANPEITVRYQSRFEHLWAEGKTIPMPRTVSGQ